jgi:hypothetical protein
VTVKLHHRQGASCSIEPAQNCQPRDRLTAFSCGSVVALSNKRAHARPWGHAIRSGRRGDTLPDGCRRDPVYALPLTDLSPGVQYFRCANCGFVWATRNGKHLTSFAAVRGPRKSA